MSRAKGLMGGGSVMERRRSCVTVVPMKKLVILLAVLSMLFAACATDTTIDAASTAPANDSDSPETNGDNATDVAADDSAESAAQDPPPTATSQAAPTTAPAVAPTAAANQSSTNATAEQAAAIQAVVDADDWCQAAAAVEEGTGVLDTIDFTNPVALEQGFTQAVAVFTAAQRLAPPEISGDVAQVVQAFGGLTAALEDAEWSFIDLDLDIINQFDGPMQLSTYNIEKYNFDVCGVGTDPGEPPTAEDLLSSDDDFQLDGTIRDQAVQGLVQAGFTAEQANCLFGKLDFTDPEALADTTQIFSVFTECGISLDQLAQLGG